MWLLVRRLDQSVLGISAGRLEISEERFIPLGFECTVLWYKNRSNSETNHTGVVRLEFTHGNE